MRDRRRVQFLNAPLLPSRQMYGETIGEAGFNGNIVMAPV